MQCCPWASPEAAQVAGRSRHRRLGQRSRSDAAVAIDGLQSLEIGRDVTTEVAFHDPLAIRDDVENLIELLLGEIRGAHVGVKGGVLDDEIGPGRADAVDVAKRYGDLLFRWNVDTKQTWHGKKGAGLVSG